MEASPSIRDLLSTTRAWVAANYPGCPLEFISIQCRYLPKPIRLVDGPDPSPTPARPSGNEHENEELPLCVREILQTLQEVGRPLSLTLLKREMDRRGRGYARRTLAGYCAELVQDGTLENPEDARPRGYRLPPEVRLDEE